MKPHPRIRKTIKWGGAALTALLLILSTSSQWWQVQWLSGDRAAISIWAGQLRFGQWRLSRSGGGGFSLTAATRPDFHWGYLWYNSPADGAFFKTNHWDVGIPLWVFWAPCGIATITAFRLDTLTRRRNRINLCLKCHYDRTGLAANANCPECGQSPRQE